MVTLQTKCVETTGSNYVTLDFVALWHAIKSNVKSITIPRWQKKVLAGEQFVNLW